MNQTPVKSKRDKLFDNEPDFIDKIGDAFTLPDFIQLPNPRSMLEARMENIYNMRNHFRKALGELGLREDISASNQRKNGQGFQ